MEGEGLWWLIDCLSQQFGMGMSNWAEPSSKSALSSLYWSRDNASFVSIELIRFLRAIASFDSLRGIKLYYLMGKLVKMLAISGSSICSMLTGTQEGGLSAFRLSLRVNILAFFEVLLPLDCELLQTELPLFFSSILLLELPILFLF